ncbi:uncharacterized protein LOC129256176 [Lytechinus pictus]|uniref:uncharacterized protein LOC129256176 n=1 Tax=Lytechinus pictus TaxID=7653 RepID=UPI0030B9F767
MARFYAEIVTMFFLLVFVFRIASGTSCGQCRNDVSFQSRPGCYHCLQSMESLIKRNQPLPSLRDILDSIQRQQQNKPVLTSIDKQEFVNSILRVFQDDSLDYIQQS